MLTITRTEKKTYKFDGPIKIDGLVDGGQSHRVTIHQGHGGYGFSLSFNDDEFIISITDGLMRISRYVYRPGHDHGDEEYLCVDPETNRVFWRTFPYTDSGIEFLEIAFGAGVRPEER